MTKKQVVTVPGTGVNANLVTVHSSYHHPSSPSSNGTSRRARVEQLQKVINNSSPGNSFRSNTSSLKRIPKTIPVSSNHHLSLNGAAIVPSPSASNYGRLINGSLQEEPLYGANLTYISPSRQLLIQRQQQLLLLQQQAEEQLARQQQNGGSPIDSGAPSANNKQTQYMSNLRQNSEKIYYITDAQDTSGVPGGKHDTLQSGRGSKMGRTSTHAPSENVYATIPIEITIRDKPKNKKRLRSKTRISSIFDDPTKMFSAIQSTLIVTNVITLFVGLICLIVAGFIGYQSLSGGQLCLISIFIIITSLIGLYGSRRESTALLVIYGSLIIASLIIRSILYFITLHFINHETALMIALSFLAAFFEIILTLAAFAFAADINLRNQALKKEQIYSDNKKQILKQVLAPKKNSDSNLNSNSNNKSSNTCSDNLGLETTSSSESASTSSSTNSPKHGNNNIKIDISDKETQQRKLEQNQERKKQEVEKNESNVTLSKVTLRPHVALLRDQAREPKRFIV